MLALTFLLGDDVDTIIGLEEVACLCTVEQPHFVHCMKDLK